jgi:hypothetical protein
LTEATARRIITPGLYIHGAAQKLGPGWQMIFDLRENTLCFVKASGERVIMMNGVDRLDDRMLLPTGCRPSLATLAIQMAQLVAITHGLRVRKAKDRVYGLLVFVFEAP